MNSFRPPLRLTLDGDALVSNWRYLKAQGRAACGAAIKADGYGLGAREVVARLRDAGCRDFFVAHWAEAEAVADLVPPGWISVLNGIDEADIAPLRELGAVPVLNTPKQIAMWKAAGGGTCHVMLDTGINRLGIGSEQLSAELLDGLDIDILMSHLASADENVPTNALQLSLFRQQAKMITAKRRSFANSAGIMLGPDYHFDLTRPGLSIYGGIARDEMVGRIAPVVGIEARVLQLRNLKAGMSIGYNSTYLCDCDMSVATLSIGYADGYWRGFSNKGVARYERAEMPVLGRVSMDLLTVDARSAPGLTEGNWAAIDFDLPVAASVAAMSQYELLTGLGARAERIWR
jgi:alanine racemase